MGSSLTRRPRALLLAAVLVALLVPATALNAQDTDVVYEPRHPTNPGAPFRPDPERANVVIARAEILQAMESVDLAVNSLHGRSEVGRTVQILESQRASYTRDLDELQPELDVLSEDTEPWLSLIHI